MTRASKIVAVLAGLSLASGLVAASVIRNAERVRAVRAARSAALPSAHVLLARAERAGICFEQLAPGVYSVHHRGGAIDARVTRSRGSVGVSAVAGGLHEEDMAAAAVAYKASGQSSELYEHVIEAADLGLIRRDALRC